MGLLGFVYLVEVSTEARIFEETEQKVIDSLEAVTVGVVAEVVSDVMFLADQYALQALWSDAKGEWEKAHEIVQQMDDVMAARIHAYLHRKEGDNWNSRYWHRRAGSVFPEGISLEQESDSLARELTV